MKPRFSIQSHTIQRLRYTTASTTMPLDILRSSVDELPDTDTVQLQYTREEKLYTLRRRGVGRSSVSTIVVDTKHGYRTI